MSDTTDAKEIAWHKIVADLYGSGGWMELQGLGVEGYYTEKKLSYDEALSRVGLTPQTALLSIYPEVTNE